MIKIKRVYDRIDVRDGMRILIDGLWPRGVRSSTPNIDMWLKEVAPTSDLRRWFSHDPSKWQEFRKLYIAELKANKAMDKLIKLSLENDQITLLFASKDEEHNNAVVVLEVLTTMLEKSKPKNKDAKAAKQ